MPLPLIKVPLSHPESNLIEEVALGLLGRLIGKTSSISILSLLLTGSRGEYLRVVELLVMVE